MSAIGTKRTFCVAALMSAFGWKADSLEITSPSIGRETIEQAVAAGIPQLLLGTTLAVVG